jgi:quercetin dioxygenase-like cupin family protein
MMERLSLNDIVNEQLERAAKGARGRSAHTVYGGQDHVLRQTVLALVRDQVLEEHENPGEATVYVLQGRVLLAAGDASSEGAAGDLLVIPQERHSLRALETSAILLTVALRR